MFFIPQIGRSPVYLATINNLTAGRRAACLPILFEEKHAARRLKLTAPYSFSQNLSAFVTLDDRRTRIPRLDLDRDWRDYRPIIFRML